MELFFAGPQKAINEYMYEEIVYAHDLNAYKVVPASTTVTSAMASIAQVQNELHQWGLAHQVTFDAG